MVDTKTRAGLIGPTRVSSNHLAVKISSFS
jgi:hypothetical protein